ncbi:MAG: NACHT domain-containing protein [Methanobacteriota archaeon]|nr:MAG: NACHT domain-containing protein [Euryarchaeota archaeon]
MRRSTKAKTNEEIQLLGILEYIRDTPKPTALPLALRQKIADRLSIPDVSILPDDFFLSDFMEHALAELMSRALGTKGSSKALTGFVIIQLRYFDFLHRGCSINKALDAFEDPHVEESVFELLCMHSLMTGRKVNISGPEMLHLPWLKSASPKTAGRYAESAMKSMISFLGDCLSDLFDLISSTPVPVSTVAIKKNDDAVDLSTLISKYTLATCSLSPAAYGIQIPISECAGRSVHAKGEPHAVRSENLPNCLANGTGTIAGLPGSGRSTLLQSIALLGNQKNLYACYYFVFSLRTFLERLKEGYSLSQFIITELISGISCSDEQRLQLVANVEEFIAARRCVLLADDLDRLDWTSQELVIAKLAGAPSVYFTVTPWLVDDVHELMRRNQYAGNFLMLSLDDLDAPAREAIARIAAKYMCIPYVDGSIEAAFAPYNTVEGTNALGVLTALKTMTISSDTRHLYFGYIFLQEILQRSGHPGLKLPQGPDDLDQATILLLRIARAAREQLKFSDPCQTSDHVRNSTCTMVHFGGAVAGLFSDPIQQLLDIRVFMHRRRQTTAQFIFPAVEELLMTLDSYYFGYPTSFLDFLFPGRKSPVIERVQQSTAHVPRLSGF